MSLSYTDFIAPNVEVRVKYIVNKQSKWCAGKIVSIFAREDLANREHVKCLVEYEDGECILEKLYNDEYNMDSEEAWSFSDRFVQLVDHINDVLDNANKSDIRSEYIENDNESDNEGEGEGESDNESENGSEGENESEGESENESEGESESESEGEGEMSDDKIYNVNHNCLCAKYNMPKKSTSFINNVFAVLFMLSPWLASSVMLYSARDDITAYFKRKYC